jgi:hypothetical protein
MIPRAFVGALVLVLAMVSCVPEPVDDGRGTGVIGEPVEAATPAPGARAAAEPDMAGPVAAPVPWENRKETSAPPIPDEDTEDRVREVFKGLSQKRADALARWFVPLPVLARIKDLRLATPEEQERAVASLHAEALTRGRGRLARLIERRGFTAATCESIELGECRFVPPGADFNRLAHWSCEKNTVYYHADGDRKTLTVRRLINWGRSWYVLEC